MVRLVFWLVVTVVAMFAVPNIGCAVVLLALGAGALTGMAERRWWPSERN